MELVGHEPPTTVDDGDGEEDQTDWQYGTTVDDGDNEDDGDEAEYGTRGSRSKDRKGRPARSRRDSGNEEELSEEGGNDVDADFEVAHEQISTDEIEDINEIDVSVNEEIQGKEVVLQHEIQESCVERCTTIIGK